MQANRPFLESAEFGLVLKFALLYARIPIVAPELILDDLLSVQPVFHMGSLNQHPQMIPLAHRTGHVLCGSIEIVTSAGELAFIASGMHRVIEKLHFRSVMPGSDWFLGNMIEHAAVAVGDEFVFDLKLKTIELFFRDDIVPAASPLPPAPPLTRTIAPFSTDQPGGILSI